VTRACPACRADAVAPFQSVEGRDYLRCTTCGARLLDPVQRLSREAERAHYRTHDNDPDAPGHRRFLAKLADPLLARLAPGSCGLDYGSGPDSTLAAMLREAGHDVAAWDPAFAPDAGALSRTYDFVACAEAIEHFHAPADELDRIDALLRPGGWLGVTTLFQTDDARFAAWRYRRDPTHVAFFREETFRLLAAQRGWTCEIPRRDVALLRKPGAGLTPPDPAAPS
jgi:SAM-dependent methyltransferase